MKSFLILVALGTAASAEPCPMYELMPEVLRPNAEVVADGGLVVIEISKMVDTKSISDVSTWKTRAGKLAALALTPIAPGLSIAKPPKGATAFTIEDGAKMKGKARVLAKAPALLPAPSIGAITSGATTSKHITRFVTVDLASPAPKGAIAMVVADAKGVALSWGPTTDAAKQVVVYSTQGGCVTRFPNGTQIAQPGDKITAFWIDATGRKSPASTPATVAKP